jgi:predicted dehydrogenase
MSETDRRRFVKAAALTAASYSRVMGASERVRIGAIGTGGRCQYLMGLANTVGGTEIAAVCDVYEPRRLEAKQKYAPAAELYADYRQVVDRKDLDAVIIGTPDHWHVPITIAAVRAGKDVYVEKPVTHTLEEGAPLIAAVKETKRVVQTGTQQRSWEHYFQAKEVIASGRLGEMPFIRTYWYQNHVASYRAPAKIDTAKLEWKTFLGSAPQREFDVDRYTNWRWYWDYGGGAMTDLFVHWVDVAHWFMGADDPSRATATGLRVLLKNRETPDTMSAAVTYEGHAVVQFDSALIGYLEGGGLLFRGTQGAMRLHRSGYVVYDELPKYSEGFEMKNPALEVRSKKDGGLDHMQNWLDCIKSRKDPNASVEIGVAAARAGHVANLALRGNGVWEKGSGG